MLKRFLRGVKNYLPCLPLQLNGNKQNNLQEVKNTLEELMLASKNKTVKKGFMYYQEAIKKLEETKKILKEKVEKQNQYQYYFMPAWTFLLAISAEIKVLETVNKDYFNSPVAWDTEINLTSHPTLIADAAKICDILPAEDGVKIILNSFRGWTLFCAEEIKCYCGEKGFSARKVALEIWLNHILCREKNYLIIKQFAGIRTDDLKHLKEHYAKLEETTELKKFYKESRLWSNVNLVWCSINRLIFENGALRALDNKEIETAREFYDPSDKNFEFGKRFMDIISSGLKSLNPES